MKIVRYTMLMLSTIFVLSGCTAGGAKFMSVESAPTNKALVYFYRPNAFQGSALSITVKDNDKAIFNIKNGQYISYLAEPGLHKFYTDTMAIDKPTELTLEAGKTYFLKTSLRVGMWTGTWGLNRVYEDEALAELKSCSSGKK